MSGHAAPRADAGSTNFGATVFGTAIENLAPVSPASAFDVCHVGVVLRSVLFVHGVLAAGLAFAASGFAVWVGLVAAASSVALPAVLVWLVALCVLKKPLAKTSKVVQWLVAVGLGAGFAWAASQLVAALLPDPRGAGLGTLLGFGPPLAGAAIAAAIFEWLRLRAQATLPAETTARLAELQSRIRPHFLFNTLNSALTLVRLDPAKAEGVLEDLAELFRVAIGDPAQSVSLGEEVELAQRYLDIEQVRFGSRLHVSWELDPMASSARLPPLILQPLVENAVRHGVEPAAEGGVIRVKTRVKLGRAVVSIANSIAPDAAARPGNGMALQNVKERLRLMHDVAAQFDTRCEAEVYRVQLVVPL